MILNFLSFSCPLLLASTGALFSEYTGTLALFMEGFISFSGFLTFYFTVLTGSVAAGLSLGMMTGLLLVLLLAWITEKFHANQFIAALGMNLFFSSIISCISSFAFNTRGVLTSPAFVFDVTNIEIISIIITAVLIAAAICLLIFTQPGIYFRITGSSSDVLKVKGVNPSSYRIAAWVVSAFFAFVSGSLLTLRVSSFVPNIASGKGWMALAAVFLGKKKPWKICLYVLLFCAGDFIAANIQNYIPAIPSSILLSFPYIIAILLSCTK